MCMGTEAEANTVLKVCTNSCGHSFCRAGYMFVLCTADFEFGIQGIIHSTFMPQILKMINPRASMHILVCAQVLYHLWRSTNDWMHTQLLNIRLQDISLFLSWAIYILGQLYKAYRRFYIVLRNKHVHLNRNVSTKIVRIYV